MGEGGGVKNRKSNVLCMTVKMMKTLDNPFFDTETKLGLYIIHIYSEPSLTQPMGVTLLCGRFLPIFSLNHSPFSISALLIQDGVRALVCSRLSLAPSLPFNQQLLFLLLQFCYFLFQFQFLDLSQCLLPPFQ